MLSGYGGRNRDKRSKGREAIRDFPRRNPTQWSGCRFATCQRARGGLVAFKNLGLYWEHDWTGDGPVPRSTRAKWHKRLASEIESYLDALDESARQALGRLIQNPAPTNRFFVFNSLNCKSAGGIRWKAIPGRTIQHQGQSGNQLVNIMAAVECRETDGAARLPNQTMRWA